MHLRSGLDHMQQEICCVENTLYRWWSRLHFYINKTLYFCI